MAATATELTREHYLRPEVREIINRFAMPGDGIWRALNGDFHRWYRYRDSPAGREARLLNAVEDYEELAKLYRTFYATLNVFDKNSWMAARPREEITSDNPLGTPADTVAYTLGVDIDKGHGYNIEDPETKTAVEAAAQFFVDYLKERGIHESVWVLFSGGGIYVQIHHEICRPRSSTPEDRQEFFEKLTDRYNRLIAHVSEEFFKAHPEYIGKVKYDALNNSKRVFKCIFSIHKKKPYAVTPLNRDAIKIDFERARVPLGDDMIAEARAWYSTYNPTEREPLLKLLDAFREPEEENERKRSSKKFREIWRSSFKVDVKYFPPCKRHIIDTANPGEGKTRVSAVLATFLYQMGWEEEEAWNLVKTVSDRNGLANADHIFDSCFGRISCPSCQKIQNDGAGYPHLGLKGLGCCQPEEECDRWPGDYATAYALGDMQAAEARDELTAEGPTVLDAFRALLEHEADVINDPKFDKWEWRLQKNRVQRTLKNPRTLSVKGEEKAHKFLGKYEKFLEKLGIDYGDLFQIPRKKKSKKETFDWRVKAKAWKVLRTGDPIQYLTDSCGRVVLGADTAFKKLACCISAQNVRQTVGIHPKLSGESSGGKTITVYSFAHHLPSEMVIKGSMSNKAGFYHNDGDRVFRILDDYLAGNEDLDTVIKQTSSEYHEPYAHRTVINQQAATLQIGSEQTWAITSIDGSQDIQVLNRQTPINVDDSVGLTKLVNDKTIERYGKGGVQQPIDKSVLVSRAIFQILRDQGYINVRIPFWDRVEWIDTSNRRNPSIFMDLLISITAMNRFQREKDSEGYYLATEADFNAAKALFTDKDAEELVKRLTARERDVINLLTTNSDGLTRDEIAEKLKVAPQRVTQILNGQKGYGGLRQKIQIAETKKSISIRIGDKETDDTRHTVHKTIYSLKDYDKFTGFDAVVRLKPTPDEPGKQGKHEVSKEVSKETSVGKEEVSKVSKREKEREKREIDSLPGRGEISSLENEKNAYLAYREATHIESDAYHSITTGLPCLPDRPPDVKGSVGEETPQKEYYTPEYLDEVLVCRRLKKAIAEGITDPIALAEACGLPVCLVSKFPGVNSISAAAVRAQLDRHRREQHFADEATKHTGAKLKAIYEPAGAALEYADLSLNLYAGCSHRCTYCYNRGKFRSPCTEVIKKSSLENIEHDLNQLAALENKTPVHMSFIGDPFDLGREDNSYTHRVLELFKIYQHPFQILTKGGMKAIQEPDLYFEGCSFGCTLTFDNPEDSKKWEPGAALPEDRIAALELAHKKGIKTWASLEPVIDPLQSLHLIELSHEFVDHYGVGKINHHAALEKTIDWPKFRADAEALLKKYGKSYKIKTALAKASQIQEPVDERAFGDQVAKVEQIQEPDAGKAKVKVEVDSSEKIRVAA